MDVNSLEFSREAFEKLKEEVRRLTLLSQDYLLIEKLRSPEGFLQIYFLELKEAKTNFEAFNNVNDRFFDLTGEYRYSSYKSFQTVMTKIINAHNERS